jgi:hypothetical protein
MPTPSQGNDRSELACIKGGGRGRDASNAGMTQAGIGNAGMQKKVKKKAPFWDALLLLIFSN